MLPRYCALLLSHGFLFALLPCSWDNPVWPKSNKSDTPLFRFVVNEEGFGAGYIDRDGNIVIPARFWGMGNYGDDDFFDGLAKVHGKDGYWYIDASGKPVTRADFATGHFSEGFATIWFREKAGFIDRSGRLAIPALFDSTEDFSEGLAAVRVKQKYGYIDRKGRWAIRPRYLLVFAFSEGAARVIEDGPCVYTGYGPCSYVNATRLPYDKGSGFDPGLPRCRYSFIDREGRKLLEQDFVDAKDFTGGLAPVGDGHRWGYIDKSGTVRIPLQFEAAEPFAEGLARARKGRKWGYVDRTGRFVIPPQFDHAEDFSEDLAVVGFRAYKYWFIDKA